jgi:hypothetical protein
MAQQQMSLFGPSAFNIQRQQAQQDQANAVAQAQLTPFQSIRASALMSGTQAGRSLAGLFGIEDPALSEAKKMEELKAAVASQWDGNDPLVAYKIFAKEASARGLTQAAIGAATQIKAFEADREKTALGKRKTEAEITLAGARVGQAEASAKASEAKASAAGQLKPSELGTLQAERDALRTRMQNSTSPLEQEELRQRIAEIDAKINIVTTREPKDKTPPSVGSDREAIAQEIYDKGFYELAPAEKAVVNKRDAELAKGKQTISVDARQMQGVNAAQVKRFDDISNNAIAAEKSISNIEAMSRALNNAFTGVGSDVALKAGQIANALGVQVTGTTETEQLKQLIANLTASQARNLPGSLSEKELMFLKEAIGNTGMTKQTLNSMLKRMRTEALTDKKAYEDVFQYQLGGNDLNKYDFVNNRSKARKEAQRISELLDKATPEQRRQLGY